MLSYAEMKKALKAKQESTTHFTADFYNTYIAAQTDAEMWEAVKASDFYNKNSCGYCVFLEIFNENLPTFRLDIYIKDLYCDRLISRKYIKSFNYDNAKSEAEIIINNHYGDNYIAEVNKVAQHNRRTKSAVYIHYKRMSL